MKKATLLAVYMALSIMFPTLSLASNGNRHLESPYYTFPRAGDHHIDLSSGWKLISLDSLANDVCGLDWNDGIDVLVPTSVQMAYYRAGKLPHPYFHQNSKMYEFLEQKVHYYTTSFDTPVIKEGDFAVLSFDGVDYTTRVWINGTLLGEHEGMFGGPSVRVDKLLNPAGQRNDIVVEVRSANYGIPNFDPFNTGRYIHSWFFSKRGDGVCPFFHHGMWNGVRLDVLSGYHLERPFMTTRSISDGVAVIDFSTEIFCGKYSGDYSLNHWNGLFTSVTLGGKPVNDDVKVVVRFSEKGNVVYQKQFEPVVIDGRCWMEESFTMPDPKLWYPNQMGDQNLYNVSVLMYVNGNRTDELSFDYGIRTIDHIQSAGIRTDDKWNDWQYVINGEKIFLKGMNWIPLDALSDLSRDNYEWAIRAARDMGIQMFRIWGTGYLETETFYDLCNKYGIMVWQDFPIANCTTQNWPQDVWEAQVCRNIFRLRNQPSLAVWCGGNEFDAYSAGNSLSVGILERNLHEYDPSRPFFRSSPDGGSAHIYTDFDPNNYKCYNLLPYVSESGIHCMSSARNNRKIIDAAEFSSLGKVSDDSFPASHPDFVHHFAEYNPARVPRMMSRASHIDDMSDPVYENMVEATQIGAGEFYQIMSEGLQSNYPVTVGLMPWVFKRPWPVVAAIELMDAFGQPTAPYYFMKRTYEKTHVLVDLPKMLYAPAEEMQLNTCVLNAVGCDEFDGKLSITILDDKFNQIYTSCVKIKVEEGTSVAKVSLGSFKIPDTYRKRFFFIVAKLSDNADKMISRTLYWPRTITQMEDPKYRLSYLEQKSIWPTLTDGPWLKPTVAANKTVLKVSSYETCADGEIKFTVTNKGKYMSPITMVDTDKGVFYCSDNYFCLEPGETKEITVSVKRSSDEGDIPTSVIVSSWNSECQVIKLAK